MRSDIHSAFPLQKDTENTAINQAENQHAIEPELQDIITAWPKLPEHIKQAIKSLIESVRIKR